MSSPIEFKFINFKAESNFSIIFQLECNWEAETYWDIKCYAMFGIF